MQYIEHHGILGQKWGVRRYQNKDGSLTAAGKRHLQRIEKKDVKWANKNYDKIYNKAYKRSKKEISKYDKSLAEQRLAGKSFINAHNQKMAEIMNTKISDVKAPSGRSVKFIAKRGDVGVHLALADKDYDMSKLKNGVWSDGRVAYKKNSVNVSHSGFENESDTLISHHGVQGMHWGIRKDDYGTLTESEYARATELWDKTPEFPGLTNSEKEWVYENFDNNLSAEEKTFSVVSRPFDNYQYTAIHKGHNEYKIIDRERIEPPRNWEEQLDDILTEVIGKDWRKYDE